MKGWDDKVFFVGAGAGVFASSVAHLLTKDVSQKVSIICGLLIMFVGFCLKIMEKQ